MTKNYKRAYNLGMLKKTAINYYGGVAPLAKALGISRAAVYQWGERVPEGSAYKLESITEGKLSVNPKAGRGRVASIDTAASA